MNVIRNITPSTGKKLGFRILLFTLLTLAQGIVTAQQLELITEMPDWHLKSPNVQTVSTHDYASKGLQALAISLSLAPSKKSEDELISRSLQLKSLVERESLGLDTFMIFATPTTVFLAPAAAKCKEKCSGISEAGQNDCGNVAGKTDTNQPFTQDPYLNL